MKNLEKRKRKKDHEDLPHPIYYRKSNKKKKKKKKCNMDDVICRMKRQGLLSTKKKKDDQPVSHPVQKKRLFKSLVKKQKKEDIITGLPVREPIRKSILPVRNYVVKKRKKPRLK